MVPKMIQRNTMGPHLAPMRAPKIGPVPAMLRNWMRRFFVLFWGTKSIPSVLETAGVSSLNGKNICSGSLL